MHKCFGENCKHKEHHVYVGGKGELESADIFFLGLGPGNDEVHLGKPFVGPAGFRFNNALMSGGISRGQHYITNAWKYWPAGHEPDNLTKEEQEISRVCLVDELDAWRGTCMVLMGNEAIKGVLEAGVKIYNPRSGEPLFPKIMKWRGSILEGQYEGHTFKVIPTIHPSAVTRSFQLNTLLIMDMKRIGKEYRTEMSMPGRTLVVPGDEDFDDWLGELEEELAHNPTLTVACDIETLPTPEGRRMSCCSFSINPKWAISVNDRSIIRDLLDYPNPKVWHNSMYDLTFLLVKEDIMSPGYHHDTMYMWAAQQPELAGDKLIGKSLRLLCSLFTDEPYYKDEDAKAKKVDDWQRYYRYNALDAAITLEVYEALDPKLDSEDVRSVYEFMVELRRPFMQATIKGIPIDTSSKGHALRSNTKRLTKLTETMTCLDREINFNSWQQIMGAFGRLGIHTDNTSREEIVKALEKEVHIDRREYLEALLEYKTVNKESGSYLKFSPDPDGRFRPNCVIPGTETGRLAYNKSIIFSPGPSPQTIPEPTRKFYIADRGYTCFYADLDQAELRIVAHLCGDEGLLEACHADEDPFTIMERESGLERTVVKNTWFGSLYGGGPKILAATVNTKAGQIIWSEADARYFQGKLFGRYPAVTKWHDHIRNLIGKRYSIRTLFGRKRHFRFRGRYVDEHSVREACNYVPQGTVPDIVSRAVLAVEETPGWDLWVHMHDGLVGQVVEGGEGDFFAKLRHEMAKPLTIEDIDGVERECVIPVTIETGPSWGELEPFTKSL